MFNLDIDWLSTLTQTDGRLGGKNTDSKYSQIYEYCKFIQDQYEVCINKPWTIMMLSAKKNDVFDSKKYMS